MAEKQFPKLSQYQAVEASWDLAKKSDPNRRTEGEFLGLLRGPNDPTDIEIMMLIDVVFTETALKDGSDLNPWTLAKKLGKIQLTYDEYVKELKAVGLDIKTLLPQANELQSRITKTLEDSKERAQTFFELIKTEWHVTDQQVSTFLDSDSIYELLEIVLAHADETRARLSALSRHAPTIEARKFVLQEWSKYRNDYKGNKSAFARDYAARLRNEFVNSKGEPLDIKEKTLREVWLSDTPPAGI